MKKTRLDIFHSQLRFGCPAWWAFIPRRIWRRFDDCQGRSGQGKWNQRLCPLILASTFASTPKYESGARHNSCSKAVTPICHHNTQRCAYLSRRLKSTTSTSQACFTADNSSPHTSINSSFHPIPHQISYRSFYPMKSLKQQKRISLPLRSFYNSIKMNSLLPRIRNPPVVHRWLISFKLTFNNERIIQQVYRPLHSTRKCSI